MIGKKIQGLNIQGQQIEGTVKLIYTDALISGTNQYVQITYLLVLMGTEVHRVYPRDVRHIYEDPEQLKIASIDQQTCDSCIARPAGEKYSCPYFSDTEFAQCNCCEACRAVCHETFKS